MYLPNLPIFIFLVLAAIALFIGAGIVLIRRGLRNSMSFLFRGAAVIAFIFLLWTGGSDLIYVIKNYNNEIVKHSEAGLTFFASSFLMLLPIVLWIIGSTFRYYAMPFEQRLSGRALILSDYWFIAVCVIYVLVGYVVIFSI